MGWAGGTQIFDDICAELLSRKPLTKERVLRAVISALEGADWDTQSDSAYHDHELVQQARKALHPEEFEDDAEQGG